MKETKLNVNVPKEILEYEKMTLSQKLILSILYQLLKKKEYVRLTINELSDYSGVSRNTVLSSIKHFKNKRWITYRIEDGEYIFMTDSSYYMRRELDLEKIKDDDRIRAKDKSFNGLHIDYQILHSDKLTLVDKFVLSYISNFSKRNKDCYTKTKNICDLLGISNSAYKKSLAKLKKLELIESEITRKNNRIAGKKMKADLSKINTMYVEQLTIEKAGIKEINSENTVINNSESTNINSNNTYVVISELPENIIKDMKRNDIYVEYKRAQEYMEKLKHYMNQKVGE